MRRWRAAGILLTVLCLLGTVLTGCGDGPSPVASTVLPPEDWSPEPDPEHVFPVTVLAEEEDLLVEPMVQLTRAQRDLLEELPVADLPRDLPERPEGKGILSSLTAADLWRGTLLPLAEDKEEDVTLYGVVAGLLEYNSPLTDGVVLRCADRAAYFPFSWGQNAWYDTDPWLAVADCDQDGGMEVALCLNLGGGTGMDAQQLYIVEPETMTYAVPDLNTLSIEVCWNETEHTVTLTPEGDAPLTAELPEEITGVERMVSQLICTYSQEEGQLWFETALACNDSPFYLVQARAPVVWKDGRYCLGWVTLKLYR